MPIKKYISTALILFSCMCLLKGQTHVAIAYENAPLNTVLVKLRDALKLHISFDDTRLAKYYVTVDSVFPDCDRALAEILKDSPFSFEKVDENYIITEKINNTIIKETEAVLIDGLVRDKFSGEILPYSSVLINNETRITDFRGRFSYISYNREVLHLKVNYLGYFVLDTLILPQKHLVCELTPSRWALSEFVVKGTPVFYGSQSGAVIGEVRLNALMGSFLAGGLNNSVMNILKLQPGISGASDSPGHFSMWGSFRGQSLTKLDGATIYDLNSQNRFLSVVNSFLVKDIIVYKGSYTSNQGNRVGGIVEINAIDGNYIKPEIKLNVDNRSQNLMLSIPLFKRSSLVLAHRRSYLNNFNLASDRYFGGFSGDDFSDYYVQPEINFEDFNAKYSTFLDNGDQYYIAYFNSSSKRTTELNNLQLEYDDASTLTQRGLVAYYGKLWYNGISSNARLSYSGYLRSGNENIQRLGDETFEALTAENKIDDIAFTLDNRFALTNRQFVETGVEINRYATTVNLALTDQPIFDHQYALDKISAYVRNNIQASTNFSMDLGLRLDYLPSINRTLFQPRFRSGIDVKKNFKINASWGVYNQFVSAFSFLDHNNRLHYFWNLAGANESNLLQSDVLSLGLSFQNNGFLVNVEAYSKRTEGLLRYENLVAYDGKSKSQGIDVLLKKNYKSHVFWLSYSYQNTDVFYNYFQNSNYQDSPFNLDHELKAVAILNFKQLTSSINYIHGAGFNNMFFENLEQEKPYSRLDASVYYKVKLKMLNLRYGVNAVNIINRKNFPYFSARNYKMQDNSNVRISDGYQPFTMLLFLELSY